MLVKDICVKCRKQIFNTPNTLWNHTDDMMWESGWVVCHGTEEDHSNRVCDVLKTRENPPAGCFFKAEQLLMQPHEIQENKT